MALKEYLDSYGVSAKDLPAIAGTYKGGLIVCADAMCVWDDLERFGCKSLVGRGRVHKDGYDFMTVNKLVETFPGNIEHCYSNQPYHLEAFIAARRNEYVKEFAPPGHVHSCSRGGKWKWPFLGHGTSGLGAVLAGLGLGYEEIVICGMPLDDGPHNGEPPWRMCRIGSSETAGPVSGGPNQYWKRAMELAFDGRVKSMSGRTADWLGRP